MTWIYWGLAILGAVLLGVFLYWQLIITEGTYLGPRVVVLLYDWAAKAYEGIKQYDAGDEQWFLGLPLARALAPVPAPLLLDVATGTGRLPRALLRQPAFDGHVIGLDLSRRMLRQGAKLTAQFSDQLTLIWQDARALPFPDDTFDAVTCLEALEFMPDQHEVLSELVRVLRPGGVLLTTNRIGRDARLMPGRTFPRETFASVLESYPLESIRVRPWQLDYDLVWAIKSGEPRGGGLRPLPGILRCPTCWGRVTRTDEAYQCTTCERTFPVADDGVIEMANNPSRRPSRDSRRDSS
jgi:SAM-dependent methyltransferase